MREQEIDGAVVPSSHLPCLHQPVEFAGYARVHLLHRFWGCRRLCDLQTLEEAESLLRAPDVMYLLIAPNEGLSQKGTF